jgi:hypothetical protein
MTFERALALLLASLLLATTLPAQSADFEGKRPRVVDPARAKAQDADRQRLLAKLRGDAPKLDDVPTPKDALAAPIFHRYDRR